jgi:hypothetical protein
MAQTSMQEMIEWATSLKDKQQQCIDWIAIKSKAEELLILEKEQSHNYADFCVRCDRDQMKLLDFNDYIKIYTNGLSKT